MSDPILSNDALRASKFALDGLAKKQEIIGQNIANVDTPGYHAFTVDFEKSLKRALHNDRKFSMSVTHDAHLTGSRDQLGVQIKSRAGGVERVDGNNVNIEVELSQMAESGIRYQALTNSVSSKLRLLRTIATGR